MAPSETFLGNVLFNDFPQKKVVTQACSPSRLANVHAVEGRKLTARGAFVNGSVRVAPVSGGKPLPVWFAFSGLYRT